MDNPLAELLERSEEKVRSILNILVESPYFYRTDDEELFFFLRRHRNAFAQFYELFYDWKLIMDGKCARVYKDRWYNERITEANRDLFDFRRRDECIAFMILLEFFENQIEASAMTVEEKANVRFRFGDLLQYTHGRFVGLFPGEADSLYTEEHVRTVLRQILPNLERYRLLKRLRPPADLEIERTNMIFEALPALYHYNASRLSQSIGEYAAAVDEEAESVEEPPEAEPVEDETLEDEQLVPTDEQQ